MKKYTDMKKILTITLACAIVELSVKSVDLALSESLHSVHIGSVGPSAPAEVVSHSRRRRAAGGGVGLRMAAGGVGGCW